MKKSRIGGREVAVPASIFEALRGELVAEVGTLQSVRSLHQAGYQAGLAAAAAVHEVAGGDSFRLSEAGFWSNLAEYFSLRGWGSLTHDTPHPAVGRLSAPDWAEAKPGAHDPDASCSFSSGFLSGLLSQLAGGAVAVLEVSCRSRGDRTCDFAFGSESAIHDLYGRLLEGDDVETALTAL